VEVKIIVDGDGGEMRKGKGGEEKVVENSRYVEGEVMEDLYTRKKEAKEKKNDKRKKLMMERRRQKGLEVVA
jgi:hypothetical protein